MKYINKRIWEELSKKYGTLNVIDVKDSASIENHNDIKNGNLSDNNGNIMCLYGILNNIPFQHQRSLYRIISSDSSGYFIINNATNYLFISNKFNFANNTYIVQPKCDKFYIIKSIIIIENIRKLTPQQFREIYFRSEYFEYYKQQTKKKVGLADILSQFPALPAVK